MYNFLEDSNLSLLIENISKFFEADKSRFIKPLFAEYGNQGVFTLEQMLDFFKKHNEVKVDWNKKDKRELFFDLQSLMLQINKARAEKDEAKSNYKQTDAKALFKNRIDCKIIDELENEDFIFVVPFSWECCKFLDSAECGGAGAKWCIGYEKEDSYWKKYTRDYKSFFVMAMRKNFKTEEDKNEIKYMVELAGVSSPTSFNNSGSSIWNQLDDNFITSSNECKLFLGYSFEELLKEIFPVFIKNADVKSIEPIGFKIEDDTIVFENSKNNFKTLANVYFEYKKIKFSPEYGSAISESEFTDCGNIQEIDFSNIDVIGNRAFVGCTGLKKVDLSGMTHLISLPMYAFAECSSLESVKLPDNLISIQYQAFGGCKSLSNIELPSSLSSIYERAFENCRSLKRVNFPENLQSIENYAFYQSGIESVTLPESVMSLGTASFKYCENLKYVDLSKTNITRINEESFKECTSLEEIKLPEMVMRIYDAAFQDCESLKKITFPSNLNLFAIDALFGCKDLNEIEFKGGTIPEIYYTGYGDFNKINKSFVIKVPNYMVDEYKSDDNFKKFNIIGVN